MGRNRCDGRRRIHKTFGAEYEECKKVIEEEKEQEQELPF